MSRSRPCTPGSRTSATCSLPTSTRRSWATAIRCPCWTATRYARCERQAISASGCDGSHASRTVLERNATAHAVLRSAAAVDPDVTAIIDEDDRRRRAANAFVEIVADAGPLRGLSVADAADTYSVLASPDTFTLLTRRRGWTPSRYERWLATNLALVLLPNHGEHALTPTRLVESGTSRSAQRGRTPPADRGRASRRGRPRTRLRTAGRPSRRRPRLMSPRRRPSSAAVTPERSAAGAQKLAHLAQPVGGLGPEADGVDRRVAASNGPSVTCRRSTGACTRRTRPTLMAAALRRRACRIITSEWSTPTTNPRAARLDRAAMATPGPQPSSMARSVDRTSRSSTAQRLRWTFDERLPIPPAGRCRPVRSDRGTAGQRGGKHAASCS